MTDGFKHTLGAIQLYLQRKHDSIDVLNCDSGIVMLSDDLIAVRDVIQSILNKVNYVEVIATGESKEVVSED